MSLGFRVQVPEKNFKGPEAVSDPAGAPDVGRPLGEAAGASQGESGLGFRASGSEWGFRIWVFS